MKKQIFRYMSVFAGATLFLGLIQACDSATSPFPGLQGTYTGTLTTGGSTVSYVASVSLSPDNSGGGNLTLNSHQVGALDKSPVLGTLSFGSSNDAAELSLQGNENATASLNSDGSCYSSHSGTPQIQLCPTDSGFTIQLGAATSGGSTYVFTRATNDEVSKLETPATYTTSQLRNMSASTAFGNREELNTVLQAKLTMINGYLSLLPHLTINSGLSGAQYGGLLSIADSVGDLAPFLLPDRWYQAAQDENLYKSQLINQQITTLDTMEIVEGLALGIVRDNTLDLQLQADQKLMQTIQTQVAALEKAGQVPAGSANAIATAVSNVAQIDSDLESNIALEYTALANAVGFVNPNAISGVTLDPIYGDINNPPTLDLNTMLTESAAVSPELQQMTYILAAAKNNVGSSAFQWLDPAGNDNGALGAGLPSFIEIAQSNVDQVQVQIDQVNSAVLTNATNAYNNYEGWIESYQLAQQGLTTQNGTISICQQNLSTNGNGAANGFDITQLELALEALVTDHTNLIVAQYDWYASVASVNRVLLQGPYAVSAQQLQALR